MLVEQDLADEVSAFMRERERLVGENVARWVLFADGQFQKAFDSSDTAVDYALDHGFIGRFLLRDLRAEPAFVPFVGRRGT